MDNNTVSRPVRTEENSVCFTGHRFIAFTDIQSVRLRLRAIIQESWHRGSRWFLCGGALGFDTLAAEEVIRFRDEGHPDIGLFLVIPCEGQYSRWTETDRNRYMQIRRQADEETVLSPSYYDGCMHFRNQYMVLHSSVCICYLRSFSGGTGYTVRFALSQSRRVINLCDASLFPSGEMRESLWNYIFTSPSASVNARTAHLSLSQAVPFRINRNTLTHYCMKPACGRKK